jgi:hypothetical protein
MEWSRVSARRRHQEAPAKRYRRDAGQLAGTNAESRTRMPLTRDFKKTIGGRAARDPRFRKELLREGVERMLADDVATAKTILRHYINAALGFTHARGPMRGLGTTARGQSLRSRQRPATPRGCAFSRQSRARSEMSAGARVLTITGHVTILRYGPLSLEPMQGQPPDLICHEIPLTPE